MLSVFAFAGHGSRLWVLLGLVAAPGAACGSADSDCVVLAADCEPLYNPDYSQVFARTIVTGCAIGSSCHSGDGAKGGLRMDDIEQTYRLLVEEGRVVAGDAECSLLVNRLHDRGEGAMPPGMPLSAAERCSIERWIAEGAKR